MSIFRKEYITKCFVAYFQKPVVVKSRPKASGIKPWITRHVFSALGPLFAPLMSQQQLVAQQDLEQGDGCDVSANVRTHSGLISLYPILPLSRSDQTRTKASRDKKLKPLALLINIALQCLHLYALSFYL